jgi:hypothetical protein
LEERIKEVPENLKQVEDIGTALLELALEGARDLYRRLCQALDEYLLKVRDKELKVAHIRERWVNTPLGDFGLRGGNIRMAKGKAVTYWTLGQKPLNHFPRPLPMCKFLSLFSGSNRQFRSIFKPSFALPFFTHSRLSLWRESSLCLQGWHPGLQVWLSL